VECKNKAILRLEKLNEELRHKVERGGFEIFLKAKAKAYVQKTGIETKTTLEGEESLAAIEGILEEIG